MPGLNLVLALSSLLSISSISAVQGHTLKHHGKGYHLVEEYKPHDFFDKFSFFQYPDPTGGFVQYVSRKEANTTGLIQVHKNHTHPIHSYVYVGADHKHTYNSLGLGRKSVRLQSHKTYTRGLFILNLEHMPHGCGTWPAWWTVGPRWPYHGEIDIIEGVNKNKYNLMSLHTDRGCTIAGAKQKGTLITNNCNSLEEDVGCGVLRNDTASYGEGFNKRGGGVYAMEWTASDIRIWHFRHHRVPKSITEGKPDPSKFGTPVANLAGSCNIEKHFRDHSIVFDLTFCGNYAGYQYPYSTCPLSHLGHAGCRDFVANNPDAFKDAFWQIRSMHVYQRHGEDVAKYHPPNYASVVPVISKAPHSATSLLPHPMGHKTTSTTVKTQSKRPQTTRTVKPSLRKTKTLKSTHKPPITKTKTVKPTHKPPITKTKTVKPTHKPPITKTKTVKPTHKTRITKTKTAKPTHKTRITKTKTAKPTRKTRITKTKTAKPTHKTTKTRKPPAETSTTTVATQPTEITATTVVTQLTETTSSTSSF